MKTPGVTYSLVLVCAVIAIGAFAQEPIEFEVAAIRPAMPAETLTDHSLIGMKISAVRVSIGQADIGKLIQYAYNVKGYQVVGPDWFQDYKSRFDIEAKLPEGATAAQVPLMLQSLLAERFHLKVHRASVETDTYALIVGPKGPKFQKKQSSGSVDDPPPSDSAFIITPGKGDTATMSIDGVTAAREQNGLRVETSTIGALTTYLSKRLPVPVIDKTNLDGEFDITMEIPNLDASVAPEDRSDATAVAVFAAVERLGLKLVHQKNPIETIVVESVSRTPTEN